MSRIKLNPSIWILIIEKFEILQDTPLLDRD